MNDEALIERLKKLVGLDQQLSRLLNERKNLESRSGTLAKQLEQSSLKFQAAENEIKQTEKQRYLDGKKLDALREQIHSRKRTLMSLGNYKLQQAAMREIETSEADLAKAEERHLSEAGKLEEKQLSLIQLEDTVKSLGKELEDLQASLAGDLDAIVEQEEKLKKKRLETSSTIDPKMLNEYDRQYERHAPDVLSQVENNACSTCAYSVVPKVMLEIQAGQTIVRCRGCGKILYL